MTTTFDCGIIISSAFADPNDTTKRMTFDLSAYTAGTSVIFAAPNVSSNCRLVCLTSADTLTNKVMTSNTNNLIARELWINGGRSSISVYEASSPKAGQLLTATGETTATWQDQTVGGSNTQVQFNNAGVLAGASGLTIASDNYPVVADFSDSTPAVPTSGAKLFARFRAGRRTLAQIGPVGVDYSFQPCFWSNKISIWTAQGGGTAVSLINFGNTATGTATTRNFATTNLFTSMRRIGYVTANANAGQSAGTRHASAQFWAGNAPRRGGYFYVARFGISSAATVATQRSFVGLLATTAVLGNLDPSANSSIAMVGFGVDSADNSWFFLRGNGTSVVKDALTGTFPARDLSTTMYEARIFCPPNGTTVFYSLEVLGGGSLFEGSASANLPPQTTPLSPQIWTNNGTTALVAGIDVVSQYIETDN